METQLVTSDDAQRVTQNLGQTFEVDAQELDELYQLLRELPTSLGKAELAMEAIQKAKRYIDRVENSEAREIASNLDKAHKIFVKAIKRWRMRGDLVNTAAKAALVDWEQLRRQLIEEEQRKREQASLFSAQEERKAEVEHLREIGKKDEAEAKAAEPLRPVSVSVDADAGKPEGVAMVEVWVPKRNENDEIVFSDENAYFAWLAANPGFRHVVKHLFGKLKRLLTDNRGMLQPPGLIIEKKYEPRTRMEESDE